MSAEDAKKQIARVKDGSKMGLSFSKNVSPWYPLFQHMLIEHDVILLESEMHEIARKVDECRR
jgi:hypothetical protein